MSKNTDLAGIKAALISASGLIIENEPELTRIDVLIGDGDHGTGMKEGFSALREMLTSAEFSDTGVMLRECGVTLVKAMGGASGVLFGTLFLAGCELTRGKTALDEDDIYGIIRSGAEAVARRGRTKAGEKTMLDALLGAVETMDTAREQGDIGIKQTLRAAMDGAAAGADRTRDMLAKKGRSKGFREKTLGIPDPGAVSVSILFEGLYNAAK